MLGWLLGAYLRRVHRRGLAADASPRAAQEAIHAKLARALGGTRVAGLQNACIWGSLDAYRSGVRETSYEDYRPLVDHVASGAPEAGWFERKATRTFGHSSSGRSKLVPFTRE